MKSILIVLLIALVSVSATSASRLANFKEGALRAATVSIENLSQNAKEASSIFNALQLDLDAKIDAKMRAGDKLKGLTCSEKLTWSGAKAYFQKGDNKGNGVQKFEEWTGAGVTKASVLVEANAGVGAILSLSAGVGVAFEFGVEVTAGKPSFADAAVSLCFNWDVSIGLQVGANAGGTVYLVFGPIEKMNDSNCSIGGEVYAAIGGGVAVMFKCPDAPSKADLAKAWAGIKGATTESAVAKMKEIVIGTVKTILSPIGVSFSAGVGAGVSFPLSASYSVADLVKKAIPQSVKDWAQDKKDKWDAFWAKKKAL